MYRTPALASSRGSSVWRIILVWVAAGLRAEAERHGLEIEVSGPPACPFLTFRRERNLYRNQHFAAECLRRGVFLHPHHNWFISAALAQSDVDRVIEVAAAAFESVARAPGGEVRQGQRGVPIEDRSCGHLPMKVVVFSNSSFSNASVRLGLQIMASQLAERGHDVDYVPVPTHPLDLLASMRRSSCIQGWFKRGDKHPVPVSEGLREYSLRAPFSRSRRYWWFENQIRSYSMFAPPWMKSRRYDACIRDTAMSGLFADKVQARTRVLRLNDNPDGLLDDVHPMVVKRLKHQINARHFDEVWPVSGTMLSTIRGIDTSIPAVKVPNGVFLERFDAVPVQERKTRSAVYVGTFNHWFDTNLLDRTACLLEDWRIDLYGPYKRRLRPLLARQNITYRGPLPFDRVPETLSGYRVGLIPFAGGKPILETMDPLKANQYLAAGLGIASTSHGSLGKALHGLAHFGNDPASFAAALRDADVDCGVLRERETVKRHLRCVTWSAIMDLVEDRLHCLLGARETGLR